MSPLATFIILLLGLWSSIHLIHRFYVPANAPPRGLLPTHLTTTTRGRKSNATKVILKGPYLRVESTAFNSSHDSLALWLSQKTRASVRTALRATFDLGIAVSLLGMALALALLAWTFVQLARRSVAGLVPRPTADTYPHAKRSYGSDYVSPSTFPARPATDIPIQLLIPGITLPLSQLPLLVGALFCSQAIHEAGHALSAALDGVPLQSLGASLTLIVPAAFVAFPAHALAGPSPRVRARIAASGPLLSALLYLVLVLPLARPFLLLGYSDISADGLLVASVTPDSPLASHLARGALLTVLDDLPLANAKESAWRDYLTAPRSPLSDEPGWCLDTKWFLGHPHGCCAAPPPGPGSEACLIPIGNEETPRCLEAPELLVPTNTVATRCEGACTHGKVCVRMRAGEEFLRIGIQSGHKTPTRVVLWRGAREEIYQSVDVTRWRPRLPFLPHWLPNFVEKVMLYTRTLTLSLFLLNVLPLSQLDGGVLLDAVLYHLGSTDSADVDLEAGSRGTSPSSRSSQERDRLSSRVLQGLTTVLLVGCVLLGMYDSIVGIYVPPSR